MDLVNRLKYFLEENKIAISQFADNCRIPRPTLSQILNGRNKKISDELISKIHEAYPDLSVLWLMFGEGSMVTSANTRTSEAENPPTDGRSDIQHIDSNHINAQPQEYGQTLAEHAEKTPGSQPGQKNTFNEETTLFLGEKPGQPYDENGTMTSHRTGDTAGTLDFAAEFEDQAPYGITRGDFAAERYDDRPETIDSGAKGADSPASTVEEKQANSPLATQHAASHIETACGAEGGRSSQHDPGSIIFTSATPADAHPESNRERRDCGKTADRPATDTDTGREGMFSVPTLAGKKITNIVVFYSDNSFQSFIPAKN